MKVHALDQWGRSVEVEIPDTTTTATVDLAPMRQAVTNMERTRARIAELRATVTREHEVAALATARAYEAEAEADRLCGETYRADFYEALARAHRDGGAEALAEKDRAYLRYRASCCLKSGSVDDVPEKDREAVAAEVERLRAEQH